MQRYGECLLVKPATIKPTIAFADFEKLDVRVGTILTVEAIPGADTLMKLTVDLGDATRTVLAGIKGERDDPTQIIGKQALFVVNLEPRRMMGQVSEGMLFDLGYADGIAPCLSVPEHSVPNGTRAG
jgi:tRNA-binding protein